MRIAGCNVVSKRYSFTIGLQVDPDAQVSQHLAKMRSMPQQASQWIETCFDGQCQRLHFESDEYFGGISAATSLESSTANRSQEINLMFGDQRQPPLRLPMKCESALKRLCVHE